MKQIPLYKREGNGRWGTDIFSGRYATVDDEDYDMLIEISRVWRPHSDGYAYAKTLLMHRVILGLTDSKIHTDHKDHDRLNNIKENLVACSQAENNRNLPFKGYGKYKDKWRAWSRYDGKHLGLFETEAAARQAIQQFELTGQRNVIARDKPTTLKSPCCSYKMVRDGKTGRNIKYQRYRCEKCKKHFGGKNYENCLSMC